MSNKLRKADSQMCAVSLHLGICFS